MKLIEKENTAKNGTCKPFITALQPRAQIGITIAWLAARGRIAMHRKQRQSSSWRCIGRLCVDQYAPS
jgi:hypothetical protein